MINGRMKNLIKSIILEYSIIYNNEYSLWEKEFSSPSQNQFIIILNNEKNKTKNQIDFVQ